MNQSQFTAQIRPGIVASMRDDDLMRCIAARDVAAFELFYEAHHRLVYRIGLRLLGDIASAEDLTQSVFLKVWTNPEAFHGGSIPVRMSRMTRNGAFDVLRRLTDRKDQIPADLPLDHTVENLIVRIADPEVVRQALLRLPAKERATIEMGFFGGMTYNCVAQQMGVPLGTIKARIRTGLQRLRDALKFAADTSDSRGPVPGSRTPLTTQARQRMPI